MAKLATNIYEKSVAVVVDDCFRVINTKLHGRALGLSHSIIGINLTLLVWIVLRLLEKIPQVEFTDELYLSIFIVFIFTIAFFDRRSSEDYVEIIKKLKNDGSFYSYLYSYTIFFYTSLILFLLLL